MVDPMRRMAQDSDTLSVTVETISVIRARLSVILYNKESMEP